MRSKNPYLVHDLIASMLLVRFAYVCAVYKW